MENNVIDVELGPKPKRKKTYILIAVGILIVAGIAAALFFTIKNKGSNVAITNGSKVSINYKLTVDGEVVDSSEGKEPLVYTQGKGDIIPGLEEELVGLKKGDKKTVTVSPEKGYGLHDDRGVQKVPREAFKGMQDLAPGGFITGKVDGNDFQAKIIDVNKDEVTLDLNHPLAGKTLNFDVEVVDVE